MYIRTHAEQNLTTVLSDLRTGGDAGNSDVVFNILSRQLPGGRAAFLGNVAATDAAGLLALTRQGGPKTVFIGAALSREVADLYMTGDRSGHQALTAPHATLRTLRSQSDMTRARMVGVWQLK